VLVLGKEDIVLGPTYVEDLAEQRRAPFDDCEYILSIQATTWAARSTRAYLYGNEREFHFSCSTALRATRDA